MDVDPIALTSRWLHVLGAIVLLGGAVFSRLVVLPAFDSLDADERPRMHQLFGTKWGRWVGIATGLILLTGLYNYLAVTRLQHKGDGPYHALMGVKMLLALVTFFFAAALAGKSSALAKIRERRKLWLTVTVLLGVAAVMIAGYLKMRGVVVVPTEPIASISR